MAKPTVYTWKDAGAPVYYATMTSYIALIRACLVDGYGSKPGAGWTIPFEDATSFVLKQGGTNPKKHCLKFYDYYPSSTVPLVYYKVAEDYSNLYDAVNRWDGIDDDGTAFNRVGRGYALNTTTYQIPWIIMATARGVYLMFGHNALTANEIPFSMSTANTTTTGNMYNSYFGDYVSYLDGNDLNVMYLSANSQYTTASYLADTLTSLYSDAGYQWKVTPSDGKDSRISSNHIYYNTVHDRAAMLSLGFNVNNSDITSNMGIHVTPNPINNSLYLNKILLTNRWALVGEVPGLLAPFHARYFDKAMHNISFEGRGAYEGTNLYVVNEDSGQAFIHDGEWGIE